MLRFLRGAREPRNEEEFADYLISSIRQLVPATVVGFGRISQNPLTVTLRTNPSEDAVDLSAITARHVAFNPTGKNPSLDVYRLTGLRWSDFQPYEQFRRTALYNEEYRPRKLRDSFSQFLDPVDRALDFDLSQRRNEAFRFYGLFSEQSIRDAHADMLTSLAPNLLQCFADAVALNELESLRKGLEKLDRGLLEIDLRGRIRFESQHARRLLAEYFGNMASLPETLAQWISQSVASLRYATDLPPVHSPLIVERGGKRLVVRSFADPESNLLTFEEQRTWIEPASLASLGLTKRQSEVLAYVAMGKSNPEIALILDTRARTISKHLEHIFARLGVETRTAAAAVAFESTQLR